DFAASPAQVLAWHRREADLLESGGQRAAVLPHLDALIAARPAQASLRARRAEAYAERGDWERSRVDGAKAIGLGVEDPGVWYRQALVQLALGDLSGYRSTCAGMLDRFGKTDREN